MKEARVATGLRNQTVVTEEAVMKAAKKLKEDAARGDIQSMILFAQMCLGSRFVEPLAQHIKIEIVDGEELLLPDASLGNVTPAKYFGTDQLIKITGSAKLGRKSLRAFKAKTIEREIRREQRRRRDEEGEEEEEEDSDSDEDDEEDDISNVKDVTKIIPTIFLTPPEVILLIGKIRKRVRERYTGLPWFGLRGEKFDPEVRSSMAKLAAGFRSNLRQKVQNLLPLVTLRNVSHTFRKIFLVLSYKWHGEAQGIFLVDWIRQITAHKSYSTALSYTDLRLVAMPRANDPDLRTSFAELLVAFGELKEKMNQLQEDGVRANLSIDDSYATFTTPGGGVYRIRKLLHRKNDVAGRLHAARQKVQQLVDNQVRITYKNLRQIRLGAVLVQRLYQEFTQNPVQRNGVIVDDENELAPVRRRAGRIPDEDDDDEEEAEEGEEE
jgi:hypothetical protein